MDSPKTTALCTNPHSLETLRGTSPLYILPKQGSLALQRTNSKATSCAMNSSFLEETVLQVWGGEEEGFSTPRPAFSADMETGFPRNLGFHSKSFNNRTRFYEVHGDESHFLQACFLCKQSLGEGNDIFMYRGDTPFCSEECRQEQIDMDEAKEKSSWSSAMGKKVATRKEQQKTTNKNHDFHIRTGTVVAG